MKAQKITIQKGQTLVLFAIGLLVLLAVSALVIDGGKCIKPQGGTICG